jgi:hypothetical protein
MWQLGTFLKLDDHMQHDHLDTIRRLVAADDEISCHVPSCVLIFPRTSPDLFVRDIKVAHNTQTTVKQADVVKRDGKH